MATLSKALLFLLLFCWSPLVSGSEGKLTLRAGEVQRLTIADALEVKVSRNGIVHLRYAGGADWEITGLRSGLVMIEATTRSAPPQTWLVEVAPRSPEDPVVRQAQKPGWLCEAPGVTCARDGSVSGTTGNFQWWLSAKKSCAEFDGCIFAVALTQEAYQAWTATLAHSLGASFKVSGDEGQMPIALAICGQDQKKETSDLANHLTGGAVERGELAVRCAESVQTQVYTLQAHIVLLEESSVQALGLSATAGIQPKNGTASLIATLRALETDHKAKTIGSPTIRLVAGSEAVAQNGGEFRVMYSTDQGKERPREGWKDYGLHLTVKAFPAPPEGTRIHYKLSLKNRSGMDTDTHLTVSSLSGEVNAVESTPVLAGTVNLASDGDSVQALPMLSSLPIIGAFFRVTETERRLTKLALWFELHP